MALGCLTLRHVNQSDELISSALKAWYFNHPNFLLEMHGPSHSLNHLGCGEKLGVLLRRLQNFVVSPTYTYIILSQYSTLLPNAVA